MNNLKNPVNYFALTAKNTFAFNYNNFLMENAEKVYRLKYKSMCSEN